MLFCVWLYSKTVKTWEVVFCLVIEHGMTLLCFQTVQKKSAPLRSSLWQFENSNVFTPYSITEQGKPSHVLTVQQHLSFLFFFRNLALAASILYFKCVVCEIKYYDDDMLRSLNK